MSDVGNPDPGLGQAQKCMSTTVHHKNTWCQVYYCVSK
jgi:hypothetical protein